MASLRKRYDSNGEFLFYQIDFRYKGRRYRRSTGTTDKKLAMKILDEIRGRIATGKFKLEEVEEKNISLKDFTEEYLTTHCAVEKTAGTALIDKLALEDFKTFAGANTTMRLVTETMARSFRAWLMNKKVPLRKPGREKLLSPATVNMKLRCLRTAFNWAMVGDRHYVDSNPFVNIKQLTVDERTPRAIQPEDMKKIFAFAAQDGERGWLFSRYMMFLLITGCRRSEATKLRRRDIDFMSWFIEFRGTKANRDRKFPITKPLQNLLVSVLDRMQDKSPEARLFPYEPKYPTFLFTRYKKWIGLPKEVHLHCFRHTNAMLLRLSNVHMMDMQDLLGHAKMETTLRYGRAFPVLLKRAAEKIDPVEILGSDVAGFLVSTESQTQTS